MVQVCLLSQKKGSKDWVVIKLNRPRADFSRWGTRGKAL